VQGNKIGTDVTGTQPLGNGTGIDLTLSLQNLIGGTAVGAGPTAAIPDASNYCPCLANVRMHFTGLVNGATVARKS
jgi:hypothetical protein